MAEEVIIETWGSRLGSPYVTRREFHVEVHGSVDTVEAIRDALLYHTWPPLPPFENYVLSFCEQCKKEGDFVLLCFRHRTAVEVPIGNPSNHRYVYAFKIDGAQLYFDLLVGASGWSVQGKVDRKEANVTITRPSGTTFTYRSHGTPSTVQYILRKLADFLDFVIKASYTYVTTLPDP